jgi:hypothetical protein
LLLCVAPSKSHAEFIGVNFVGNSAATLTSTTSAGFVPQTNFNNLTGNSRSGLVLKDSNGVTTTATVSFSSPFTNTVSSNPVGGDEILNHGAIVGSEAGLRVNLTSIPYATYDLYIYNPSGFFKTTLGSTTYYGRAPISSGPGYIDSNAATPYVYNRALSTMVGNPTLNANYVRFEGLSGASQSYTVAAAASQSFINSGGFQIVNTGVAAVPEPSTYAMMFLGLGAIAFVGWKRKRSESLQPCPSGMAS